jgi:exosortase D (VPLPA-CTERM-specific)
MQRVESEKPVVWTIPVKGWFFVAIWAALLGTAFYAGIKALIYVWDVREEYSYGYMIPFITLFLIWQKKDVLERTEFQGSWTGVAVIGIGLVLFLIGNLSTITTILQYAMLTVIIGSAIAVMGWNAVKLIFIPLLFLVFMIPLPSFFLNNLSSQLQLVSSSIGVDVARLFGVSVFLEGNVIDLGTMKLQVVEACSGLRYLFPLMSLSFICAYIFRAAFWKRAVVFLSSIPITVLMNSIRIGVISVLVEYWGKSQAEGFLHYFEGWVIFMVCLAIIIGEIWLLARIGRDKTALREVFNLDFPAAPSEKAEVLERGFPKQYWVTSALMALAAISSFFIAARAEIHPTRSDFSSFPMAYHEWQGKRESLEQMYINVLKFDDYILADYIRDGKDLVNLYVAYYASQKAGESAHSPRSCIPGGGWQIKSIAPYDIQGVLPNGKPLTVNRLLIQQGGQKELVYYWFQQRGRIITNEYMVKWYLLWDALTQNRTDGALVRLTTSLSPVEDIAEGDRRLTSFSRFVVPELRAYIPD